MNEERTEFPRPLACLGILSKVSLEIFLQSYMSDCILRCSADGYHFISTKWILHIAIVFVECVPSKWPIHDTSVITGCVTGSN